MTKKDDLFEKLKNLKIDTTTVDEEANDSTKKGKRQIDDFVLNFEILDSDDELVASIKQLINSSKVYKSQLYDTLGRSEGYNMIYSLQKGVLSWKRCEKWCNFLGYKIDLSFIKIN